MILLCVTILIAGIGVMFFIVAGVLSAVVELVCNLWFEKNEV